jgi:protein-disulfide isomerase
MKEDSHVSRRDVLAVGAAGVAGLAGCLGGASGSGDSQQSLSEHPAATDIGAQPHLGPNPLDARATIIAFEDPSCARCRAFEQQVVPKLRSDIDAGTLSLVSRTYPVVYQWGKPAVQALEATYDRSEDAYWELFAHYFDEQDAFSADNVLERTGRWLSSNSDLDADAVVADAEAKTFDAAVQADLTAGDEAGADGVTPSLFLFRDGQYQTVARGSVSYDVLANTLGL